MSGEMGEQQPQDDVDPEILNSPHVICGLAFDIHGQFAVADGDARRTPPLTMVADSETQPAAEAQLTLSEWGPSTLKTPVSLQSVKFKDSRGEPYSLFHFRPGYIDGTLRKGKGALVEDINDRQRIRYLLTTLHQGLLETVAAPLEAFDPERFVGAHDLSEQNPLDCIVKIDGGMSLYRGKSLEQTYSLPEFSVVQALGEATTAFRALNKRRPTLQASVALRYAGREHEIPEKVWRRYYDALSAAGCLEQAAIKRAL